jgi:hypothetical protein
LKSDEENLRNKAKLQALKDRIVVLKDYSTQIIKLEEKFLQKIKLYKEKSAGSDKYLEQIS